MTWTAATRVRRLRPLIAATALVAMADAVAAQTAEQSVERFTADSVIAVDVFGGQNVSNRPQIVIDASAAMRVGDNWQLIFRPWLRQARPSSPTAAVPDWDVQLYQVGMRYERPGRVSTRVDVGQIVSPVGLGLLDWRPNLNPTIVPHISYVVPMPVFDPTVPRQVPVSQSYPLGGLVTVSSRTWDARAALVNAAPTRGWALGANNNPLDACFRGGRRCHAGDRTAPRHVIRAGSIRHRRGGAPRTGRPVDAPVWRRRRILVRLHEAHRRDRPNLVRHICQPGRGV
jgi:hypothetical protein